MACKPAPGKECNQSKEALFEYLGPLDFMTIYNEQRVDARNFTQPI